MADHLVSLSSIAEIQSSLAPYGDLGGLRSYLDSRGIDFTFGYVAETLGNSTGGIKRGVTYEGRFDGAVDAGLGTLAGLEGLAFHAKFYQINGRGLSGNNTLDLFVVSSIEAFPSTKLYELWFEQKLLGGTAALRFGQLSASTEFFANPLSSVFVSSAFGWPPSFGNDLLSGGAAYPLATPGARLKISAGNVTILAGVFDDNPAGPYRPELNSSLPEVRDLTGTAFRIQDSPFAITEAALAYNQDKDSPGLPGTLRAGVYHDFGQFAALDTPLAATYRGNGALYGAFSQTLYQEPETGRTASAVLRVSGAPGDRNLIDFYTDAGLSYQGLFPGRRDDIAGAGAAYAHVSRNAARLAIAAGGLAPDYQAQVEATYQIAVASGFSIQPDLQYIFHPRARLVADPATGAPIHNAAIFGLRATVHF